MTDFRETLHARIDLKAVIAKREIKVMAMRINEDLSKLASRYIRSAGQSRRYWNERNGR